MQIVIRTAVAVFLIVLLTFAAVWAIVMPLTSDQGDTLTLHLSFPTPMSLALAAVERNALASDWTAIQIESNSQTEWRVEQEAGKSIEREKGVGRCPDNDVAALVLADKASICQPAARFRYARHAVA